jgi:hypothetical protein
MATKQGYNDRLDESMGMRNGPEKMKEQSYKSRRNESRGMCDLGHEKKPGKINPLAAQNEDLSRLHIKKQDMRGNPKEAWNYKY